MNLQEAIEFLDNQGYYLIKEGQEWLSPDGVHYKKTKDKYKSLADVKAEVDNHPINGYADVEWIKQAPSTFVQAEIHSKNGGHLQITCYKDSGSISVTDTEEGVYTGKPFGFIRGFDKIEDGLDYIINELI